MDVQDVDAGVLKRRDKPGRVPEAPRADHRMGPDGNRAPGRRVFLRTLVLGAKDRHIMPQLLGVDRQIADSVENPAAPPGD